VKTWSCSGSDNLPIGRSDFCNTGTIASCGKLPEKLLDAQHCRELEIDTMAHLGSCHYNGKIMWQHDTRTFAHLSNNVWIHTVILALKVMHHISSRSLEMII